MQITSVKEKNKIPVPLHCYRHGRKNSSMKYERKRKMKENRIYHHKVDINSVNTRDFYDQRAQKLLGGVKRKILNVHIHPYY